MGTGDGALSTHAAVIIRHAPLWAKRAWVVPALFFSVFLLYPLIVLIDTAWSTETLTSLTNSGTWMVALVASAQSLLSVGLSLALGLPVASVLSRYEFPGRSFLWALATVPFVLPTVVVALGFQSLFGGLFEPGLFLVVLAHAYINIAVVIRVVGAQWGSMNPQQMIIARTLGATPWRVFRTITLPNLTPSILAASCVVFVFSFTSLGIVTILGDGSATRTLEQVILRQSSVLLDFPGALASAALQLLVVSFVLFLASRSRGAALTLRTGNSMRTQYLGRVTTLKAGFWVFAISFLSAVFIFAPIASIVWDSISGRDGFTLSWWISLPSSSEVFARLGSPLNSLGLSLVLAIFTAFVAACIGGAIAIAVMGRNPFMAFVSLIPLGLSAATVGLGTLLAFGRAPLDLRSTGILIPIAHALVAVPLVVALAAPVLRAADPRRMLVASTLGASPHRAWWTAYGSIIRVVMLAAGGLAGAVSLGEFGAASFLARPDSPTVPIQISKLLSRPGEQAYATAAVLSVILVVATLVLMLVVDRMNSKVRL